MIGLIVPNNIEKSPYVKYYMNVLEENHINYELIEWCRENKNNNSKNIIYCSKIILENKLIKLYLYLGFIKFCKKKIYKRYTKLIIFTAQLGILLENFLNKNYKNRYIVDIRDYNFLINYRKKSFYNLLKNSYLNVISSPGFLKWLPKEFDYLVCHNIDDQLLNNVKKSKTILKKEKLKKILTIGMIRDLNQQKEFIKKYSNNYILEYRGIGKEIEILKREYSNLKNLKFYGRYNKEKELHYYINSDLINLIVGNDINSKTLIANRFYNALITDKIMIGSKDSYMGNLITKYKLGYIFEETNEFDINSNLEYNKNLLLEKIIYEQKKFKNDIMKFLIL